MKRVNISAPQFGYDDEDPDGFGAGMFRPGPELGASLTGISVYELPPGQAVCPYHYEYGEEEWLLVVSGRPTLRHPGGEDELAPWDLTWFAPGPEGAHEIRNDTEETVRLMMFSNINHPGATVYPDSDKIGIWTGNRDDDALVRRASSVGYYDGEPPRGADAG
ncbi:MAG: cupin domain-containing protein [Solirubrobacterales bacterium]|nr:cupin domain-containing protein [Solirubrobacterales bacterium]